MKKVLICNQKGGVGKSLLADELAFSFERSGIPMAFLDLDCQGGTLHKTDQRQDAEVAVIDTPGALQKQMGVWMTEADAIVIPTRPTSRDIEPMMRMLEIASKNAPNTPVVVVINAWNRWRASSDFRAWFQGQVKAGKMTVMTLPQSEQFVQASAAGQSVIEYAKSSKAARAMQDVVNTIRGLVDISAE